MRTTAKKRVKGLLVHNCYAHSEPVNAASIGKGPKFILATGGDDKVVNIWTLGKDKPLLTLTHTAEVEAVIVDEKDQRVAAGSRAASIKIWNIAEGKLIKTLGASTERASTAGGSDTSRHTGHRAAITAIDFHPYGSLLATGSMDTQIKLWDARQKGCMNTFRGNQAPITCLKHSPDGKWVVSGDAAGVVRVHDLEASKLLHTFTPARKGEAITCMEFHPEEYMLAVGSAERKVTFYDMDQFSVVASSNVESHKPRSLKFGPDKATVLVASDGSLKVWGWEPSRIYDSVEVNWMNPVDMVVTPDHKLLGVAFNKSQVSAYSVNLLDVAPFDEAVAAAEDGLAGGLDYTEAAEPAPAAVSAGAGSRLSLGGAAFDSKSGKLAGAGAGAAADSPSRRKGGRLSIPSTTRNPHAGPGLSDDGSAGSAAGGDSGYVSMYPSISSTQQGPSADFLQRASDSDFVLAPRDRRSLGGEPASSEVGAPAPAERKQPGGRLSRGGVGAASKARGDSSAMAQLLAGSAGSGSGGSAVGGSAAAAAAPGGGLVYVAAPAPVGSGAAGASRLGNGSGAGDERKLQSDFGKLRIQDAPASVEPQISPSAPHLSASGKHSSMATSMTQHGKQQQQLSVEVEPVRGPRGGADSKQSGGAGAAGTPFDKFVAPPSRYPAPGTTPKAAAGADSKASLLAASDPYADTLAMTAASPAKELISLDAHRAGPLGIDVSNFLGGARAAPERDLSRDQLLADVGKQHAELTMVFSDRLSALRVLRTLWVQGNLRGVFEALKKTHDQGVIVDFLKAAEESLKKSNSLTLDIARDLIQTVKGVLTSQFETFVETGLRYLKLLLLSFTPIIESTRAAASKGTMDFAQEDRLTKCNEIYHQFKTTYAIVEAMASKHRGGFVPVARECKALLDKLIRTA